jgi:N-acyl-D-aspartate/D-glutamate deacylase
MGWIWNVGIRAGRIEAISEAALDGVRVIDAAGLVVAPGFIDLHRHGQNEESYRSMVLDGVTTGLELEIGTADVAAWYEARAAGQIVNYGVSVGHVPVRMAVMDDPGTDLLPTGPGGTGLASTEQLAEMQRLLGQGLRQGALAVGFGLAYTPAATTDEFATMMRVAAQRRVSAHVHLRDGADGLSEALKTAAELDVPLHVVHVNSSGGSDTAEFLRFVEEAVATGQDVTTEAYPYEAGMSAIESVRYDDWETWNDERFQAIQWLETGERLTRGAFARYRQQGGRIIVYGRTEGMTRTAIQHPLTIIASDGRVLNGAAHPRATGTFSKVLGKYVREDRVLGLMEALRKMTLAPARRLESRVPAMGDKGRIRIGADADLTLFDPRTVRDRSTYQDGTIPPDGIQYVVISGTLVVEHGKLVEGARPGRAIRAPTN